MTPPTLNMVMASINKSAGETVVQRIGKMEKIDTERIPTGVKKLDDALGGGFPVGRMVELYGLPACLDKDTFIPYKIVSKDGRKQNNKGGTIENLYYRFHKIPRGGRGYYQRSESTNSHIVLLSITRDEILIRNEIVNVVMSGIKECYQLTTASGKNIVTTKDHMFYIGNEKFKKLEKIKEGDNVFIQKRITGKKPQAIYKEVFVKYHPTWTKRIINGSTYHRGKVCEAVMEANMNGIILNEYINFLNKGTRQEINKLNFIPQGHVVHHINHNHEDNSIENLRVMSAKEHNLYHASKSRVFMGGGYGVKKDRVVSIVSVGKRKTYDISCQHPLNNFVAEGIIVHNSGKTLIAQLIIAQAQKMGGDCVFVDAEGSFDPEFAKKLGVNVEELALVQTGIGEDIIDTVAKLLKAEPMVVVIDSVGAMITRTEFEESVEKVFMAPKARLMSKGLPKLTALNRKTLIIFINQQRNIITTWGGGGMTTTGGMALGFYSSVRLEIKRDRELLYEGAKKTSEVIGQLVLYNVTKNKTAAPHKRGSFRFFFDGRIVE